MNWEPLIWGCIGAGIVEVVSLYKLREDHISKWGIDSILIYAVITLLMIVAGGAVSLAHSYANTTGSPLAWMNLGVTGPLALAVAARGKGTSSQDKLKID